MIQQSNTYAGEQLIDDFEEFQQTLEGVEIDNKVVKKIQKDLVDSLHTLKMLQMTIDIPRKNVANLLQIELQNMYLQDLDITRFASEFLQKTKEFEILQVKESNILKQALSDLILAYNEYEEALKVADLENNVDIKRKKKIGSIPRKIMEDSTDTKLAEILLKYDDARQLKDAMDRKIKTSVLKKEFANMFANKEEAAEVFKQATGDAL